MQWFDATLTPRWFFSRTQYTQQRHVQVCDITSLTMPSCLEVGLACEQNYNLVGCRFSRIPGAIDGHNVAMQPILSR